MKKNIFKIIVAFVFILIFYTSCTTIPSNPGKSVKVTFLDYEGNELCVETTLVGKPVKEPLAPKVEGHEFIGWDTDLSYVDKDITVSPIYKEKSYTVTFVIDGEVLKTQSVLFNRNAVAPVVPIKEGYIFKGWNQSLLNIKEDTTIEGTYEIRKYTVTFIGVNGEIIEEQSVEHGKNAQTPSDLKTPKSFKFLSWDNTFNEVTEDLTITGVYQRILGEYKCYVFGELQEDISNYYEKDQDITLPEVTREGYQFIGWFMSNISLDRYTKVPTKELDEYQFEARFIKTKFNELNVTAQITEIKKTPTQKNPYIYSFTPVIPSGLQIGATNYTWITSDSSVAMISEWSSISIVRAGYCVLTGILKADQSCRIGCVIKCTNNSVEISSIEEANNAKFYNVRFTGIDDSLIEIVKVIEYGSVVPPVPPIIPGKKFVGWSEDIYGISADTTIKAIYEDGDNPYTGKKISIIGDSISTFEGYIPKGYKKFYPYPVADVYDVNETWWMQAINKLGARLHVNNSYAGTCVGDNTPSATKNKERLEKTLVNGLCPDVIIIFMGSNDCASQYVTLDMFESGYTKMMENIKEMFVDTEIVLMSLPTSVFYTTENQQAYNNVIKEHALKYNAKYIDMQEANISNDLVDSAHPTKSGMTKIAQQLVKGLLN